MAAVVPVCTVGVLIIWLMSRYLDCLGFGDLTAESMGVPVKAVRAIVLVTVALMTAATVSAVGAIGFVGLIVPHAIRMVTGPGHATLIPFSALVGAVLLTLTDSLSRTVFAPQEVPVGVFTAIVGVPTFFLILRGRRQL